MEALLQAARRGDSDLSRFLLKLPPLSYQVKRTDRGERIYLTLDREGETLFRELVKVCLRIWPQAKMGFWQQDRLSLSLPFRPIPWLEDTGTFAFQLRLSGGSRVEDRHKYHLKICGGSWSHLETRQRELLKLIGI
ncbi:MAG: hypothetical protein ACYCQJ_14340 [Nitrososphaerales archaeon]